MDHIAQIAGKLADHQLDAMLLASQAGERYAVGFHGEGLVLVNAMNITASVFINDDESGLHHDYEVWLEKLAPEKPYKHGLL